MSATSQPYLIRHVPVFISPDAETGDIGGDECDDVGDHRLVGPQVVLYVFGRALDIHRSLFSGLSALRWTDPLGNTLKDTGHLRIL